MPRVADILATKGSLIHSIPPGASVYEAIERMVQHNIGSLLVLEGDEIIGIFTERDYLRRVTLNDLNPRLTQVRQVMTERPTCVQPDRTVQDCMALMTRERFRHLPVVEAGRTLGMISIGDLVKHVSREQEVEIRSLTEYITGRA
jgi:CBS domain-containing protein